MKKIILTVPALSVAIATSCNKDGEGGSNATVGSENNAGMVVTTMVRLN